MPENVRVREALAQDGLGSRAGRPFDPYRVKGLPVRHRIALLALLGLGSSALAAEPIALQALTSTSGQGVELLLDDDPATGWRPEGDANNEGVLLRLEQPREIDGVSLRPCTGSSPFEVSIALDGAEAVSRKQIGPEGSSLSFTSIQPRSVFVRLTPVPGAQVCLGELRLLHMGKPVPLVPPREVPGTVTASSVLAPEDAFRADFLFDHRLDFGWAEGDKGPGKGQSLTLTLQQSVELTALELWNGYQRSEDHFRKNARAKKLAVSVDGGPSVSLAVKDTSGPQRLALPSPLKGRVWTFLVEDIYPGKVYPDLVLSELRLVDARGPFGVRMTDDEARQQRLRTRLASSPLAKSTDHVWHEVCYPPDIADNARRLKLRSNGTFVYYEEGRSERGDSSQDEVFDGAWVMKKPQGPWVSVELFGRRQRREYGWIPYAAPSLKDSVNIAGGPLEVARVEDLGPQEFQKLVASWARGIAAPKVSCIEDGSYERLVAKSAIVVRGKSLTDLLALP